VLVKLTLNDPADGCAVYELTVAVHRLLHLVRPAALRRCSPRRGLTRARARQECILDGKQYAALQEAGREKYEEDVEGCVLLFNNQASPLPSTHG